MHAWWPYLCVTFAGINLVLLGKKFGYFLVFFDFVGSYMGFWGLAWVINLACILDLAWVLDLARVLDLALVLDLSRIFFVSWVLDLARVLVWDGSLSWLSFYVGPRCCHHPQCSP